MENRIVEIRNLSLVWKEIRQFLTDKQITKIANCFNEILCEMEREEKDAE